MGEGYCSGRDPHIPAERVFESAGVMRRLGATGTSRLYPKMGHRVNRNELEFGRAMMDSLGESMGGGR